MNPQQTTYLKWAYAQLQNISKVRGNTIIQSYYGASQNIKNEIALLFEKHADKDGLLPREEMMKSNRMQKFNDYLNTEIANLTNTQNKVTADAIITSYMEAYYTTGYYVESSVLANLAYGVLNKNKLDHVLFNPLDLIKWTDRNKENNKVLIRQLKEELMKGMVQGKSYHKIAKAVSERLNIGANKAITVVQTETHRSSNAGTLDSQIHAKSKGVKMKKRWSSTLDDKTRHSHQELDGQTVEVEADFTLGTKRAKAPSHFGDPKEDINCRCSSISVIEGYEPKTRRARNAMGKNEVIPWVNYKDWKKK